MSLCYLKNTTSTCKQRTFETSGTKLICVKETTNYSNSSFDRWVSEGLGWGATWHCNIDEFLSFHSVLVVFYKHKLDQIVKLRSVYS